MGEAVRTRLFELLPAAAETLSPPAGTSRRRSGSSRASWPSMAWGLSTGVSR